MSIKLSGKGKSVENCPIGQEVCYPSCFYWLNGKCAFEIIIPKLNSGTYMKDVNMGWKKDK